MQPLRRGSQARDVAVQQVTDAYDALRTSFAEYGAARDRVLSSRLRHARFRR